MRHVAKQGCVAIRVGLLTSTALAAVLLGGDAARAACNPAAANNVTAICTGVTVDQNAPDGYGTAATTNLTVTVVPGATVTGTNNGVRFNTGSVDNSGAISGGASGISAGTANVTNSGTISGVTFFGISAGTANVTNSGTISSGGFHAILGNTTANVTNSGAISGFTDAVFSNNTANVTNSGAISGGSDGVQAVTANVTNSGAISGGFGGINAVTANVTNSGTISGVVRGIFATTTANVTNSGTISGGLSDGIQATTAKVTNSGTISGLRGINAVTGNATNSGTIIGNSGTAIQFTGVGLAQTLTVLPGARFGGLVDFGGGADTVNFGPGSWILNTANFNAGLSTVTTGGNAYFVTPNQIIVADVSGFAAMNRAVMDITHWIASVLPENPLLETSQGGATAFAAIENVSPRFEEVFASLPSNALPYSPTPVFKGGTVNFGDGNAIWAKGFGGHREQKTDGFFIGSVTTGYGGAIGLEGRVATNLRLGAFIGGSRNETDLDSNTGSVDTDALFGGVYARATFGASFLDLSLIGGRLENDSQRNIGGGLALQTASATYDGWFLNPGLTLGHRFGFAQGLTITPAIKLRYVTAKLDGYSETGSSANLTVGERDVAAFEERAELSFSSVQAAAGGLFGLRLTAGALAQQRSGDSAVSLVLLGQNFLAATPDRKDIYGFYGGAGVDWQLGRVALFASGEVTGTNDATTTLTGKGGMRVVF